jgi:hypothetical protein
MPKDVFEIGRVTLRFDASGKVIEAVLKPSEYSSSSDLPDEFSSALLNLSGISSAEQAATQALAAYFVLMGHIESHDPEKGTIKQRVIRCEGYDNKVPHECEIMFYYEMI